MVKTNKSKAEKITNNSFYATNNMVIIYNIASLILVPVKVGGHEDASSTLLGRALAPQAADLSVVINLRITVVKDILVQG